MLVYIHNESGTSVSTKGDRGMEVCAVREQGWDGQYRQIVLPCHRKLDPSTHQYLLACMEVSKYTDTTWALILGALFHCARNCG